MVTPDPKLSPSRIPASPSGSPTSRPAGPQKPLQAPLALTDALEARFTRLTEAERIAEYFYDPNTRVPNEVGFKALHLDTPREGVFAHYSIEGVKFVNDNFGHDQGQLLYRMAAVALQAADPQIAKVRGDFGSHASSQEAAERIAERANASLPEALKGFRITVATGATWEQASAAHAQHKEAQERAGQRAERGTRPLGVSRRWGPSVVAFPDRQVEQPQHPELVQAHRQLDRSQQLAAYRDPMTGLLSHTGIGAAARKGDTVLSIDVDGLKATDRYNSGLADEVLRKVGQIMGHLGGDDVSAGHPHGDEFSAAHPNPEVLRNYGLDLKELLSTVEVRYVDLEKGLTYTQKGIGISYGLGATHEQAERALEHHKADRTRAGERDVKGEFSLAQSRLEVRPASDGELRQARARRVLDLGRGGLVPGHDRGGQQPAHEGDHRALQGQEGRGARPVEGLAARPEARAPARTASPGSSMPGAPPRPAGHSVAARLGRVQVSHPARGVSYQVDAVIVGDKAWEMPGLTDATRAQVAESLARDNAAGRASSLVSGRSLQDLFASLNREAPAHLRSTVREVQLERSPVLAAQGLRPETLSAPAFRGRWRDDGKGTVSFAHEHHHQAAGAELQTLKGSTAPDKSVAARGLWEGCAPAPQALRRIVVTERALDALSFHQLRGDSHTHYISVGGTLTSSQQAALGKVLQHFAAQAPAGGPPLTVVSAFSNSREGVALSRELQNLVPPALAFERSAPPHGRDWNATVQAKERDYIRSQGIKLEGRGRELGR